MCVYYTLVWLICCCVYTLVWLICCWVYTFVVSMTNMLLCLHVCVTNYTFAWLICCYIYTFVWLICCCVYTAQILLETNETVWLNINWLLVDIDSDHFNEIRPYMKKGHNAVLLSHGTSHMTVRDFIQVIIFLLFAFLDLCV